MFSKYFFNLIIFKFEYVSNKENTNLIKYVQTYKHILRELTHFNLVFLCRFNVHIYTCMSESVYVCIIVYIYNWNTYFITISH